MKKKKLINLVYQQSKEITRLNKEKQELRDKFEDAGHSITASIVSIMRNK